MLTELSFSNLVTQLFERRGPFGALSPRAALLRILIFGLALAGDSLFVSPYLINISRMLLGRLGLSTNSSSESMSSSIAGSLRTFLLSLGLPIKLIQLEARAGALRGNMESSALRSRLLRALGSTVMLPWLASTISLVVVFPQAVLVLALLVGLFGDDVLLFFLRNFGDALEDIELEDRGRLGGRLIEPDFLLCGALPLLPERSLALADMERRPRGCSILERV